MFDFTFDSATKKSAGQLAVAAGAGLYLYNHFERPRAGIGLPLALVAGGAAVLALSSNEPTHSYLTAGPQEQADLLNLKRDEQMTKYLPYAIGGAAALTGILLYMRSYA